MSPVTEFARDFCAGIGPLQLGVVLVIDINHSHVSALALKIPISYLDVRAAMMEKEHVPYSRYWDKTLLSLHNTIVS